MLNLKGLIAPSQVEQMLNTLADATYIDGKKTAGWSASTVKHNQQLDPGCPQYKQLEEAITQALRNNLKFQTYSLPKQFGPIIFSRYQQGMAYGPHVDNPIMSNGNQLLRIDISFTVFLSAADSYEGGELVIDKEGLGIAVKGNPGDAFLYPSNSLHQVKPVTSGCRQVAVGWVQSLVASTEQRNILFELDSVSRKLFEREQHSTEFDILFKNLANLKRMWMEL
jgi:PKHD-type hydroxylase